MFLGDGAVGVLDVEASEKKISVYTILKLLQESGITKRVCVRQMTLRPIHSSFVQLYTKVFFIFSFSLIFHVFVAIMRVCHRHGDTNLYHIMSTKLSPPRVTGYMPA